MCVFKCVSSTPDMRFLSMIINAASCCGDPQQDCSSPGESQKLSQRVKVPKYGGIECQVLYAAWNSRVNTVIFGYLDSQCATCS